MAQHASVVFTGTLASGTRRQAEDAAQRAGFTVHKTVKGGTTYLVIGDMAVCAANGTRKAQDAARLGVQVLSEQEWEDVLEAGAGAAARVTPAPAAAAAAAVAAAVGAAAGRSARGSQAAQAGAVQGPAAAAAAASGRTRRSVEVVEIPDSQVDAFEMPPASPDVTEEPSEEVQDGEGEGQHHAPRSGAQGKAVVRGGRGGRPGQGGRDSEVLDVCSDSDEAEEEEAQQAQQPRGPPLSRSAAAAAAAAAAEARAAAAAAGGGDGSGGPVKREAGSCSLREEAAEGSGRDGDGRARAVKRSWEALQGGQVKDEEWEEWEVKEEERGGWDAEVKSEGEDIKEEEEDWDQQIKEEVIVLDESEPQGPPVPPAVTWAAARTAAAAGRGGGAAQAGRGAAGGGWAWESIAPLPRAARASASAAAVTAAAAGSAVATTGKSAAVSPPAAKRRRGTQLVARPAGGALQASVAAAAGAGAAGPSTTAPHTSGSGEPGNASGFDPETAAYNGVRPLVLLADGDERSVYGSSDNAYKLKRVLDHYYCTCPAWAFQRSAPQRRTCKHLRALLGDEYERERCGAELNFGTPVKRRGGSGGGTPATTPATAGATAAPAARVGAPKLLLAHKWERARHDPVGWWISEKLDGVRALWDGSKRMFVSRLGNEYPAPSYFTASLPGDVDLDGEIYGGRGRFQFTVGVAKTANSQYWTSLCFKVFDIPSMTSEGFEERMEKLKELSSRWDSSYAQLVEHTKCTSLTQLDALLEDVERQGGEGLMIRQPGSKYVSGRSTSLLKIKSFVEGDALVIGHEPGKGKYTGMTGALKCKMACGKTFKVSSGLTDQQRDEPPEIGCIIAYKCQEMTDGGVPRFPVFLGVCADKTCATDPPMRAAEAE